MAEEAFASGRCDAGQKLEALDAVADAARELAALPPVDRRADDEKDKSNRGGVVARVGKERRFAPKSLARLRDGIGHNAPRRTRAHLVGGALAYPLLAHTAAMLRRAEEDAARVTAAERDAKKTKHPNDEDAAHVPGGGVDAVVLGRALGALGECCAAARNAPDAATLAGATLELVASHAVCDHPRPHVRRAAFFAAVGAVSATPAPAAWRAVRGGADGNGTGEALGRLLAWTEEWAERARARDPDEGVRGLALRCALAAADLQQRAARLDAAGGSPADARAGDDPMFLLKNIRAFAIDGL